jgi:hypothetical protein
VPELVTGEPETEKIAGIERPTLVTVPCVSVVTQFVPMQRPAVPAVILPPKVALPAPSSRVLFAVVSLPAKEASPVLFRVGALYAEVAPPQ